MPQASWRDIGSLTQSRTVRCKRKTLYIQVSLALKELDKSNQTGARDLPGIRERLLPVDSPIHPTSSFHHRPCNVLGYPNTIEHVREEYLISQHHVTLCARTPRVPAPRSVVVRP